MHRWCWWYRFHKFFQIWNNTHIHAKKKQQPKNKLLIFRQKTAGVEKWWLWAPMNVFHMQTDWVMLCSALCFYKPTALGRKTEDWVKLVQSLALKQNIYREEPIKGRHIFFSFTTYLENQVRLVFFFFCYSLSFSAFMFRLCFFRLSFFFPPPSEAFKDWGEAPFYWSKITEFLKVPQKSALSKSNFPYKAVL